MRKRWAGESERERERGLWWSLGGCEDERVRI
jgi:hypothetical protein